MTYYTQPGATFMGSHWAQNNQPCVPPSTFQDLMYAFPKPRLSGRIVKPRSAGTSPSSAGRRRTTTMHSSPMYRQLPNQDYQASLNAALLVSAIKNGGRSRPMSWHPATGQTEYSEPSHYYPPNLTMNPFNLPVTQACPQPQQAMSGDFGGNMLPPFTPAEIPTMQQEMALTTAESHLPIQDSSFLQTNNPQVGRVFWDGPGPGMPSFVQPASNEWPLDMLSMNQSIPSADVAASNYGSVSSPGRLTEPVTPDFLPIQQFGDDTKQSMSTLKKPNPEDELVGMGLYNNPDMFTDGSLHGVNGKGLKLEETFTPSSDNDADNEADNEADEADNDAESDDNQESNQDGASQAQLANSQRASKQLNKPTDSMMQKSFFFDDDDDDLEQRLMIESRPSFNFPVTSCMNYGYGWI